MFIFKTPMFGFRFRCSFLPFNSNAVIAIHISERWKCGSNKKQKLLKFMFSRVSLRLFNNLFHLKHYAKSLAIESTLTSLVNKPANYSLPFLAFCKKFRSILKINCHPRIFFNSHTPVSSRFFSVFSTTSLIEKSIRLLNRV